MPLPSTFGERLFFARHKLGLSQEELGEKVGLSGHTIGRLERGRSTQIKNDALRSLARVLGVSVDWLLTMDIPDEGEIVEEPLAPPHV